MTLPPFFRYRSGRLFLEGADLEALAAEHGTPLYAYSASAMREAYRSLEGAFRGLPHRVLYALKANSNLSVCRLFAGLGAGAEVVSGGELERALTAGFKDIVFSGVGKTPEEIREGLKAGLLLFNAESEEELEVLAEEAGRLRKRAPVSLRVNPDIDPGTHRHITTGRAENKFGLPLGRALAAYRRARALKWLEPLGVHAHLGSQITSPEPYRRSLSTLLRLASALAGEGLELRYVDVGGGLGVRYRDETPLDPRRLAAALRPAWGKRKAVLLLEPGRFLTAAAGVLLSRVLYRKEGVRRRFVVLDAGMNDLLRPALYEAWHPIVTARRRAGPEGPVDVVGPVCETADTFARGRVLPWPRRGDVWAILMAGAYGFSMGSQYNSRPRPAEVLIDGAGVSVARKREGRRELTRLET